MNLIIMLALQYIIITLFNTYVLDLSWSKRMLVYFLLVGMIPAFILFSYIGPLSTLYFLIVSAIFFYRKTSDRIAIFHIFMSIIIFVMIDHFSSIVLIRYFNQEMDGTNLPFIYPFFLMFFGTIFAFIYKKIVRNWLNRLMVYNALTYVLSFLCIVTVIFIYINIIAIDQNNFYENVKNNFSLFLVFFILLIVSIFIVLFLALQRYKIKQKEEELKNFEAYIASIEQINQDMRKFKHDYVNILTSLKTFIDDKNYPGLHTYFYDHILEMSHHAQLNEQALMMLNNLKIDSLKGLFTTKIMRAQAQQIPFYVEVVEEITDIPIDPITLNRLVGILLDNAIEAANDAEDKEVRVAIIQMNEAVLMVINNTYDTSQHLKIHELYQTGFSTKGNNRGLGLSTLHDMKKHLPNVNSRTSIHPPYFTQELEFRKEKP